MDQASFLVGKLKSGSNANADFQNIPFRQLAELVHSLFQAGLIEVLHHEVQPAPLFTHGIDPDDIGVRQRSRDLDFVQKFLGKSGVMAEIRTEDFQCHLAIQAGIPGKIDGAHATLAQRLFQLIASEKGLFATRSSTHAPSLDQGDRGSQSSACLGEKRPHRWTMPFTVVTGGAGFLGSHLTDRLLKEGHQVLAVDNLITGNERNLDHLRGNPKFRFLRHDVTQFIAVEGAVDFVFHFASPASPIDYLELPIQTLKVGSLGTHNALGLAKAKGAKFLLASTSECYGDPLVHPQKEDYWGNVNPIGPRGVYDEAKRFAEAMTMAYHRYHKVDTKIVRIFNTYGPRMRLRDGRVVPAFIGQALQGEPLTVFGDGKQTRSFCYVSDLIDGIYRLSQSDFHEPVNIGNPLELTIAEFAERIRRLTGTKSEIIRKPLPVDDPKQRQPDITRAKKLLGWEPKVALEDGLRETIRWFQAHLDSPERK